MGDSQLQTPKEEITSKYQLASSIGTLLRNEAILNYMDTSST